MIIGRRERLDGVLDPLGVLGNEHLLHIIISRYTVG